jgi:hypothetical protein
LHSVLKNKAEKKAEQKAEMKAYSAEKRILTAHLRLRFGELPAAIHHRIETADADTLLRWSEHVLTAATLDEILTD